MIPDNRSRGNTPPHTSASGTDNGHRHNRQSRGATDPRRLAAELDEQLAPTRHCPCARPVLVRNSRSGVRAAVPFGCHRASCEICGRWKRQGLFRETAGQLIRFADTGERRAAYATVVGEFELASAIRSVRRLGGEYLAVRLTLAAPCVEILAESGVVVDLEHAPQHPRCSKSTTTGEPVAVLIHLPAGTPAPQGFAAVTTTTAIEFAAKAMRCAGRAGTAAVRTRLHQRSRGWGDPIERPKSVWEVVGPCVVPIQEVRRVVEALAVQLRVSIDNDRHGPPVGWAAPPAKSLTLQLLLAAAETTYRPDPDVVLRAAREWFCFLSPTLGCGPRVERVIRSRLWCGPDGKTTAELLAADEEDKAAERLAREAEQLIWAARRAWDATTGPRPKWLEDLFGVGGGVAA